MLASRCPLLLAMVQTADLRNRPTGPISGGATGRGSGDCLARGSDAVSLSPSWPNAEVRRYGGGEPGPPSAVLLGEKGDSLDCPVFWLRARPPGVNLEQTGRRRES